MGGTSDTQKYIDSGKQTVITDTIEKIANGFSGGGLIYIAKALSWIQGNLKNEKSREAKERVFRKRTASEIIEDGFVTGCTDSALVFIAICRAHGIPTKYVEVIDNGWLKEEETAKGIKGHVFAECFIGNQWYQIDPSRGLIYAKPNYKRYTIFGKGLDSWDLGITDFGSLKEKFTDFSTRRNTN